MTNDHFYEGHDLEVLASDMPRYYRWILEQFLPELRGLAVEYGAGIGTASRLILEHVERLDLVEPSPNLAHRLEAQFQAEPRVKVFAEPLETHVAGMADASMDSVVLVNVLEHVEEDGHALAEIRRALRPGGCLLLFVPALSWLMSDLDRLHGHFRRYHRRPLVAALSAAGFEIVRSRYMDLPGALAWWLLNTVGGSVSFNPRMVAFYDRFVVPVARVLEGLIAPPIGKNIVVVARRPETP